MPVDEGIDVLKQKYDANLAKKKAEEAKRLAAIIAAQKAKELAEQRAEAQRLAAKKAAEQRAQVTKNVPTVVTQDILNKLRDGDMKSLLSANPGVSQPIVGQTLNVPTLVKGTEGRITDPLNQEGTKLTIPQEIGVPRPMAQKTISGTLTNLAGNALEIFGNKFGMNLPQRGQPNIHTYKPDFSNSNRAGTGAHGDTFVPPNVEMRAPEEIDTILTNAASGFDQEGNPAKFPNVLYGEEMRATYGDLYLNYSKMLIDSGYVYDRTQDRFIYARPQDDLVGADVEEDAPPEITTGGYGNGGYDPWVDFGGGGGGGGKYEIELPGGFGLINWRVATG